MSLDQDPNLPPQGDTDPGPGEGGGNGNPPQGGDGGNPPADTPPAEHWTDKVEMLKGNEALKGYESPEAFLKAHEDMQKTLGDYKPLEKPEDVQVTLPEGVTADDRTLSWFKGKAVEMKLSQGQAQAVLDGYLQMLESEQVQMREDFEAAMRKPDAWGQNYDANVQACGKTITFLDQAISKKYGAGLAGKFSKWVETPAVGNSPMLGHLLMVVSHAISPDALMPGGGSGPGKPNDKPLSHEELAREVFAQAGAVEG